MFKEYLGGQFRNPRGIIGALCCLGMNVMNRAQYKGVTEPLTLKPEDKVLDIGYGNGHLVKMLDHKFQCSVYGIDISEDMKKNAVKRNRRGVDQGRIHLETGDCCELPFDDETFDAVTTVNTIYFWQDTAKGLAEIFRVMKPDGIFSNAIYSKEWMAGLGYTKIGFQLFTPEEIGELAKEAGFRRGTVKRLRHGKCYIIKCIK